jgi:hypothetical protein
VKFLLLACSVPGCGVLFEILDPKAAQLDEPLCPLHTKARAVEEQTPGCDRVGEEA